MDEEGSNTCVSLRRPLCVFVFCHQYVTFEPDHGGWNNIRMAMEVVLVFAFATGRTLVMPPEQGMYLLNKGVSQDDNKLHFSDFFYLHRLREKMELMEMKDFLEQEVSQSGSWVIEGRLVDFLCPQPYRLLLEAWESSHQTIAQR